MKITRVKIEKMFKVCPNCGYEDGFHSMIDRIADTDEFHWNLICPECHTIYDIGLRTWIDK